MITVNISDTFPIIVSLVDDTTGNVVTGRTIHYDVRTMNDIALSPAINGTLTESMFEPGIYKTSISIPTSGSYLCYATCSGFLTNVEEIIVKEENIYDLVKMSQSQNVSVENVNRTTASGHETSSQLVRNVPYGQTDYILTKIKASSATNWNSPVASGIVYAWYNSISDLLPYKMGGNGL